MDATVAQLLSNRPLVYNDIESIAILTSLQRDDATWRHLHTHTLTASNFHDALACGVDKKKTESFRARYFTQQGCETPAMRYGIGNEPTACAAYKELRKCEVRRTGLWLLPSAKLGASPDGLVYDQPGRPGAADGCLEIKCPYTLRDATLEEFERAITATFSARRYWDQVQGELAATGLPWCDLVVWCPADMHVTRIQADAEWARTALPQLEQFFDTQIAPYIGMYAHMHLYNA